MFCSRMSCLMFGEIAYEIQITSIIKWVNMFNLLDVETIPKVANSPVLIYNESVLAISVC